MYKSPLTQYSDEDSDTDSSTEKRLAVQNDAQKWDSSRKLAQKVGMPSFMLSTPMPNSPPPQPKQQNSFVTHDPKPKGTDYYSDMDDDSEEDDQIPKSKMATRSNASPVPHLPLPQNHRPNITPTPSTPPHLKEAHKAYSDFYDYSDMDNEDDETPFEVPKFTVPEQRGATLDQKIRHDRDVPVGGRNQDYLGLAYIYKLHRPYSDHNYKATCVLCHQRPSQDVFFPCEHRCVCRLCIKNECFVEDRLMSKTAGGYCMCPLCATTIKRILPHENGKEVQKYWEWVEEIVPELPPGFLRNFRRSASALETVYVNGKLSSDVESICPPS